MPLNEFSQLKTETFRVIQRVLKGDGRRKPFFFFVGLGNCDRLKNGFHDVFKRDSSFHCNIQPKIAPAIVR